MGTRRFWLALVLTLGMILPAALRAQDHTTETVFPFPLNDDRLNPGELHSMGGFYFVTGTTAQEDPAITPEGLLGADDSIKLVSSSSANAPLEENKTPVEELKTPAPTKVRGQDYTMPEKVFPIPLGHDRMDTGGLYTFFEFLFLRQTNPLDHQLIATRGFYDNDGSITGTPGMHVGSGDGALYADDAGGPGSFQPGWAIGLGYRFQSGVAVEINWWHLSEAKYSAVASILPPGFTVGNNLADSFISSFVYNFPNEYAGPARKVGIGDDFAVYGIWNGASIMTLSFVQRFDQWDVTARIPITQTDNTRCYGLIGPRLTWIWERFQWRSVAVAEDGGSGSDDNAIYSNIVSNRMYGVHVGCGNEWRLGDLPIGSFAFSMDFQGALFIDFLNEQAKYERADRAISHRRKIREFTMVPEVEAQLNLWYYPIEAVMIRVGYNAMAFFNTKASPEPVSFNYGGVDPPFVDQHRLFHGINIGLGLIF